MNQKQNILIVDDKPENLELMTSYLSENETYKIYQTIDVNFAENIVLNTKINLILTDWEMPVKNGIEFTKSLKSNKQTKNIPVIIVTGKYIQPEKLEEAFKAGAVDFIYKPYNPKELHARVDSVLKINQYQKQLIENKNKELANQAIHLLEKNEQEIFFYSKLKQLTEKINKSKEEALDFLEDFVNEMLSNKKIDKTKDFEGYFNQLHPDFTKRLTQKFPALTASEIRLSIFVRMNMDSKTIADLQHTTTNSIKTARSRLRTKLNLKRSENLSNFIAQI